ncbi:hypothetical protein CsSME_00012978 [Camellia sinensis var. sinensis]
MVRPCNLSTVASSLKRKGVWQQELLLQMCIVVYSTRIQ